MKAGWRRRLGVASCLFAGGLAAIWAKPADAQELTAGRALEYQGIDELGTGLDRVYAFPVSKDGRLFVPADNRTSIAIFSEDGQLAGTIGRGGEGPGEFRRVTSLGFTSEEHLWVFDSRLQRVTVFEEDGTVVSTEFVPGANDAAVLDAGAGVVTLSERTHELDNRTPLEPSDRIWLIEWRDQSSQRNDTLDIIRARDSRFQVSAGGQRRLVGFQPWSDAPRLGGVADGGGLLIATPLEGSQLAIRRYGQPGLELASSTVELPTEMLTSQRIDTWVSTFLDELTRTRVERSELEEALITPQIFPGIAHRILGFEGGYWVELGRGWDGSEWSLVDRGGEHVGTVQLAKWSRVVAAKRNQIWVLQRGSFDLPSIVRYDVTGFGDWD